MCSIREEKTIKCFLLEKNTNSETRVCAKLQVALTFDLTSSYFFSSFDDVDAVVVVAVDEVGRERIVLLE